MSSNKRQYDFNFCDTSSKNAKISDSIQDFKFDFGNVKSKKPKTSDSIQDFTFGSSSDFAIGSGDIKSNSINAKTSESCIFPSFVFDSSDVEPTQKIVGSSNEKSKNPSSEPFLQSHIRECAITYITKIIKKNNNAKCVDNIKNKWYTYDLSNGMWKEDYYNLNIIDIVEHEIRTAFEKSFNKHWIIDGEQIPRKIFGVVIMSKIRFTSLSEIMNSCKFIIKVVKQLSYELYCPTFIKELNSKKYLVGFKNGVYDLYVGEFRQYKSTDLISINTGCDYNNDSHTITINI